MKALTPFLLAPVISLSVGLGAARQPSAASIPTAASWSALGSGTNESVFALTVFDDGKGAGPALYAGGLFTSAGGSAANGIARWDGASWSPLGGGVNGSVAALLVFDDGSGSGPALFVAGSFTGAGDVRANRIAKWSQLP